MSTENETVQSVSVKSQEQPSEVNLLLQTLLDDSSNLQSMYKSWSNTLKSLEKEMNKERKKIVKDRPKRKVNQKPQLVNSTMRSFMKKHASELEVSDSYKRQDMMKVLSNYIKSNNLQDESNKKQWKRDDVLTKLFNLEKEHYTFMQINGLISRVIVSKK